MSSIPPDDSAGGNGGEADEVRTRTSSSGYRPLRVPIDHVPRRSVVSDLPPARFDAPAEPPIGEGTALDDSTEVELEVDAEEDLAVLDHSEDSPEGSLPVEGLEAADGAAEEVDAADGYAELMVEAAPELELAEAAHSEHAQILDPFERGEDGEDGEDGGADALQSHDSAAEVATEQDVFLLDRPKAPFDTEDSSAHDDPETEIEVATDDGTAETLEAVAQDAEAAADVFEAEAAFEVEDAAAEPAAEALEAEAPFDAAEAMPESEAEASEAEAAFEVEDAAAESAVEALDAEAPLVAHAAEESLEAEAPLEVEDAAAELAAESLEVEAPLDAHAAEESLEAEAPFEAPAAEEALEDEALEAEALEAEALEDEALEDEALEAEALEAEALEAEALEAEALDEEALEDAALEEAPDGAVSAGAPDAEELELEGAEIVDSAPVRSRPSREFTPPPAPPPDVAASSGKPSASPESSATNAEPAAAPKAPAVPKRKRPWYEDFFTDDYLRTVRAPRERDVAREVDFIEQTLELAPGSTILDVGCGLGLHSIELTMRGYLVVGLDLSLPMLSRASDEAQDRGLRINFLHGDMREMTFEGAFDGVLCWGTTFGYFDDEANRRVIQRLHHALRPGGRMLLDTVNRDYVVRSQPNLVWFEGDGCICMEESTFNYITSRLEVSRNVILDDGKQRDKQYSIRLYSLHEIGQILHQSDFRVMEVSGSRATPGVYFGADSPRMTILAERRTKGEHSAPPPPGTPNTNGGS